MESQDLKGGQALMSSGQGEPARNGVMVTTVLKAMEMDLRMMTSKTPERNQIGMETQADQSGGRDERSENNLLRLAGLVSV